MKGKPPDYYPIFLNLKNRQVIVVGGGSVAERKVKMLIKFEAKVTVISPAFTTALNSWGMSHQINRTERPYQEGDLHQAVLAFAATDRPEVNRAVVSEAIKRKIWVNVADQSTPGDFIVPAVFSETDFMIAVSTRGQNPTLAVRIRDRIKIFLSPQITRTSIKAEGEPSEV